MSVAGIQALKAQVDAEVRRGNWDGALSYLRRLEAAQPEEPLWPKRQAEVLRRQGRRKEELAALVRTSQLEVESGQVLAAIATCKLILDLDENHSETLDRLHLLYTTPTTPSDQGEESAPRAASAANSEPEIALPPIAATARDDSPLEELVLTEVLPDARPLSLADLESAGVTEIPLDPYENTQPLDLQLDALDLSEAGSPLHESSPTRPDSDRDPLFQSQLFGSLDPAVLGRLLREVEVIDLAPGDTLFHQGDPSERLCVVVHGAVVPIAEEAGRIRLNVIQNGDFFGEIGLLADQPRNATVEALVETRLLAFDRALVWKLLREHPPILGVLLRALRERLIDRLVRTSPFFAVFARADRNAVARQFRLLEVRDDTVVIQQGVSQQGLFVVLAGELEVVAEEADGDKTLGVLQAGEIFGEMSTLHQRPAIATVISRKKCWLFTLTHARFEKIARRNPRLLEMVQRIAKERHQRNRPELETR